MKIKKGDKVLVIAGRYRGKTGIVEAVVTARNQALDRVRREGKRALKESGGADLGAAISPAQGDDDRLSLIFTCCHPSLSTRAQVRGPYQVWWTSTRASGLRAAHSRAAFRHERFAPWPLTIAIRPKP